MIIYASEPEHIPSIIPQCVDLQGLLKGESMGTTSAAALRNATRLEMNSEGWQVLAQNLGLFI